MSDKLPETGMDAFHQSLDGFECGSITSAILMHRLAECYDAMRGYDAPPDAVKELIDAVSNACAEWDDGFAIHDGSGPHIGLADALAKFTPTGATP